MAGLDFAIGLMLVLSNLLLLPTIALSLIEIYIIDFYYLMGLFSVSSVYHLCQADFYCIGPLENLQQADHVTVWSTLFWLYLTTLDFDIRTLVGIQVGVERFFVVFSFLFVDTSIFPITFLVAGVCGYIIKIFVFKIPILKYDILFGAVGLLLFGVGLWFHLTAGPIRGREYAWKHLIWHILVFIAAFFLYLVRMGFSSLRLLRIDKKVAHFSHNLGIHMHAIKKGGFTEEEIEELKRKD